jgi:Chalcone isomerase-like
MIRRAWALNAIVSIATTAVFLSASGLFSSVMASPAPIEVAQSISGARQLGQSRLVVYGFNIYDAKLWAGENFAAANYSAEPFALELRYLRSFNGASIAEISLKEMRKLGKVSDEKAAAWLAEMKRTFPDVKKGDALLGIHRPDGSASFSLNGKPIGDVRDEDFTRLFFGIWLSAKTSEPKMRNELIGAASSSNAAGGAKR